MRRLALPLLTALNAVLLCALVWIWFTPDGQLRELHWRAPLPVKGDLGSLMPSLPGTVQADTSRFLGMLERPLFSPSRRPPPPPPPPKADVPEPVNRFAQAKLSGVFEGVGTGGIIINYDGKDRRVLLGDILDGWKLQSVSGIQATFTQSGQTRLVPLRRALLGGDVGAAQNLAGGSKAPVYVNRSARRSALVQSPAPVVPAVIPNMSTSPLPAAPAASLTPDTSSPAPGAQPPKASFGGRSNSAR